FRNSDLRAADFAGAELNNADLFGSNLSEANFSGAVLDDADLCNTNLQDLRWRQIRGIHNANLCGVKNAPDGFLAWALHNGGVEKPDEQNWLAKGLVGRANFLVKADDPDVGLGLAVLGRATSPCGQLCPGSSVSWVAGPPHTGMTITSV